MSNLEAVRRDLALLPLDLQQTALASIAETLAARLDEAALRDSAPLARELRSTLEKLEQLALDAKPIALDPLDELNARRTAKSP